MKYHQLFVLPLMLISLTGCVSPTKIAVLEPVGPAPFGRAGTVSEGRLEVYSAREKALAHIIASDVVEEEGGGYESAHTDYTIYGTDGKVFKQVRNARNMNDPSPALVSLPAGQYQIQANAETGDGWTTRFEIPVVVKSGQKTVVHLESNWSPPRQYTSAGSLVRSPDGRTIGWRADN